MLLRAIVKVVVLIPPPVDKGEAPIHIKNMVRTRVGAVSACMEKLLKPAVLQVVAPRKDTASFPRNGRSCSRALFSKSQNNRVPPIKRKEVVVMTIRVVVFTILTCEGIRLEEPVSR